MMDERVTVTATRYDGEPVVLHPSHDFGHLFCRACGAMDGEPRLRRRCKPVVAAPTADEARGLDALTDEERRVPTLLRMAAETGREFHGWRGFADQLESDAAHVESIIAKYDAAHNADDREPDRE